DWTIGRQCIACIGTKAFRSSLTPTKMHLRLAETETFHRNQPQSHLGLSLACIPGPMRLTFLHDYQRGCHTPPSMVSLLEREATQWQRTHHEPSPHPRRAWHRA